MDQEYISVRALSRKLDVSEQTVYRYVREKVLPFVRVGRSIRFNAVDVDNFLANGGSDHEK